MHLTLTSNPLPLHVAMSLSAPFHKDAFAQVGKMSRDTASSLSYLPHRLSAAQLSLQHLREQNAASTGPKKDGSKSGDPAAGLPAKGKPRLLLMGQRR